MLLSVCVSYMFQVICLNHYLVFKLEVVVMAECQMFRLSCLQHILMWIYWWMRRKFLIKSTVVSKTPLSFDEVLKPILLIAQRWSSVRHAALQMLLFCSSVGLLFWVPVWEMWQAMSCPVPDLSHSPWVWPCPCSQYHSAQIPQNKTLLLSQAVLWDLVVLRQVGVWLLCPDDPGKITAHRGLPHSQLPLGTELQF